MRIRILCCAVLAACSMTGATLPGIADEPDRLTTGTIPSNDADEVGTVVRGGVMQMPDENMPRGDFRDTRVPEERRGWNNLSPDPHEAGGDFKDTRVPGERADWSAPAPDPHELRGDFRDTRVPGEPPQPPIQE